MEEVVPTPTASSPRSSRFGLAPPRRFVLPAILLLVSEQPSYGYNLQKDLRDFQLGPIDRPTTYRALAQLETDGLVDSWTEAPKAGQTRRVYGITPLGQQVLRIWMNIIGQERDCLGRVLRRYHGSGKAESMLDEVERSWAAALDFGWSPLPPKSSTTSPHRLVPIDTEQRSASAVPIAVPLSEPVPVGAAQCFRLVPDRSVVLLEVRSTAGAIGFGALGLTGSIVADVVDGAIRTGTQPTAHVEVAVEGLRSGNRLYDAELLRRINSRRFPTAELDLRECAASGGNDRYRLEGELTFHGVTRPVEGSVRVDVRAGNVLVVTGEQVFDIRDFDVKCPTVLMLRFYPDVRVRLHVEAELEEA
jgi:DNA-binding PadR family transcriptional regulator